MSQEQDSHRNNKNVSTASLQTVDNKHMTPKREDQQAASTNLECCKIGLGAAATIGAESLLKKRAGLSPVSKRVRHLL